MKITKDFLNKLSDFGEDWIITGLELDEYKQEAIIDLEYKGSEYNDPETEEVCSLYDHAPERIWRHLDLWNCKTYIRAKIPRVKTKSGEIKTIRLGWSDKHDRHTYEFEHKVIDTLLATKNQTKTAELLKCSFRLVNRIIHRSTERGLKNRQLSRYRIEHISIDEKSFKKGHQYVSVLSHPQTGSILNVGEQRDGKSVNNLLQSTFTPTQLKQILTVGLDMWQAYINSVRLNMPQAEIVHDRFHLIKYLNQAIDQVRKREVKDNESLKHSRYALLKNEENRTENQKIIFAQIMKSNLEVSKAYHAKETFKSLFDYKQNDKDVKELFVNWATTFFKYQIKELSAVILKLLKNSTGVINALISNLNNAMAERLNGKIQEVKLIARGYRKFKNFRSAILFFHGNLALYPLKW